MGPVLEQSPVAFEKPREVLRAIGLPPRPEDHVVGAFDGVDAVHLDEAEPADQREKFRPPGRAGGRLDQRVAVEEKPPRRFVAQERKRHAPPFYRPQVRDRSASQFPCASFCSSGSS